MVQLQHKTYFLVTSLLFLIIGLSVETCGAASKECPRSCSGTFHGKCSSNICVCEKDFEGTPDCSVMNTGLKNQQRVLGFLTEDFCHSYHIEGSYLKSTGGYDEFFITANFTAGLDLYAKFSSKPSKASYDFVAKGDDTQRELKLRIPGENRKTETLYLSICTDEQRKSSYVLTVTFAPTASNLLRNLLMSGSIVLFVLFIIGGVCVRQYKLKKSLDFDLREISKKVNHNRVRVTVRKDDIEMTHVMEAGVDTINNNDQDDDKVALIH